MLILGRVNGITRSISGNDFMLTGARVHMKLSRKDLGKCLNTHKKLWASPFRSH